MVVKSSHKKEQVDKVQSIGDWVLERLKSTDRSMSRFCQETGLSAATMAVLIENRLRITWYEASAIAVYFGVPSMILFDIQEAFEEANTHIQYSNGPSPK